MSRIRSPNALFSPRAAPLRPWRQLGCCIAHARDGMLGTKAPGQAVSICRQSQSSPISASVSVGLRTPRSPAFSCQTIQNFSTKRSPEILPLVKTVYLTGRPARRNTQKGDDYAHNLQVLQICSSRRDRYNLYPYRISRHATALPMPDVQRESLLQYD